MLKGRSESDLLAEHVYTSQCSYIQTPRLPSAASSYIHILYFESIFSFSGLKRLFSLLLQELHLAGWWGRSWPPCFLMGSCLMASSTASSLEGTLSLVSLPFLLLATPLSLVLSHLVSVSTAATFLPPVLTNMQGQSPRSSRI